MYRNPQWSGRLTLLLLIVLLSTGCATKIKVNMLKPAEYHEASLTKTVAVLPFSGPGGSEFAAETEGILGSINIDDKPYFILVDRAAIDKTLSELKFSQSGIVDPKTAAKIGQLVGAQGIYTGLVTLAKASDSPYTLYKKADKLMGKPNDDITLALTRTSEAVKHQKKLKEELKNK